MWNSYESFAFKVLEKKTLLVTENLSSGRYLKQLNLVNVLTSVSKVFEVGHRFSFPKFEIASQASVKPKREFHHERETH